jgi:CRP-like cAMP-binding protein
LDALDEESQRMLLQRCHRMKYAAGAYLFHKGEAGDSVHILASGKVAVLAGGWLSEPITLSVASEGEIFGEQALVHPDHRRSATIQAMTPVETLVLHRADFEDLCRRHQAVTTFLIRLLSARVDRLTQQLVDANELSASTRIYRGLLLLASSFGVLDSRDPIPVTQQQVASAAGVKLRITSDVLTRAKQNGLLNTGRKRIFVSDWTELRRRARAYG